MNSAEEERGGGLARWQVRGDGGSILQSYGLREKELGRQHARGKWHVPGQKAMQRGTVSEVRVTGWVPLILAWSASPMGSRGENARARYRIGAACVGQAGSWASGRKEKRRSNSRQRERGTILAQKTAIFEDRGAKRSESMEKIFG
ncbi:hypothetical protein C8J57DRAFT_1240292 [Mycena rebaudengoi]|nr:hypothetical protein C8J57DRAFT_1240292 [Mycena rebaudengoi]